MNALINRGITYRQKSETDKAIADFSEAIRQGMQTSDLLRLVNQAERGKDPELAGRPTRWRTPITSAAWR